VATPSEHDVERLRRAIALARKGRFAVEPNPPVGCVIESDDGGVVGEGWHAAYGRPHAEVVALRIAADAARGATAYVSLAPCGRHGKTPPCAAALVEAGIRRVVFAAADPDPDEVGHGLEMLRRAGVRVNGPVEDVRAEAGDLLGHFRAALAERERPWTVCKWAMSADGRIAPARGAGGVVSGDRARRLAHAWRGSADGVAVGVDTVGADDPLLTCRLEGGPPNGRPQPRRVVFDGLLETPVDGRLALDATTAAVWILATEDARPDRRDALEAAGCRVITVAGRGDRVDLRAALAALRAEGLRRLLVEGGALIHGSLFRAGLVDQVSVFVAPRIFGGRAAVPAVEDSGFESLGAAARLEDVMWRRVGEDLLLQGYVRRGGRP
jgi:diaminohydroxyphosphoribosylaminopyrimidine deaminase/5-amino-6-(5-phosphoribosylamino)uracil reductase